MKEVTHGSLSRYNIMTAYDLLVNLNSHQLYYQGEWAEGAGLCLYLEPTTTGPRKQRREKKNAPTTLISDQSFREVTSVSEDQIFGVMRHYNK